MEIPIRPAMMPANALVPILMSGGAGTRLWPLSREAYPKQFHALNGELTLLQNTALRASALEGATAPVVIGSEAHRFLIADQLREAGVTQSTLLLEPEGRDTAPAAAVAAHFAEASYGENAIVLLMAADHVIEDVEQFTAKVKLAQALAAAGHIVTFGIQPTRPETGFGYLRRGAALDGSGASEHFKVDAFVEKPDAERAQAFIDSGEYYWNSGMFMFRVDRFLAELDRLQRPLSQCAHAALMMARHSEDGVHLNAEAFASCKKISLDYAVMEKLDDIVLVPLDVGWDDVGSWAYLGNLPASDDAGNHTQGDVLLEDSSNNLVRSDGRLIAMVGVSDHVVIETADAVLIAPRDRVQEVKGAVESLRKQQRTEATQHARCYRPWGHYETVAGGDRFQVKRIVVKPGQKLSLQMHHHRAEHWIVVRGTARVNCGDREYLCSENESTYIPLGTTHRLENPGVLPLELIEVQSGAYLGEDDIVRFEDVYGRIEPGCAEAPPATVEPLAAAARAA
ncbi:MAG TPA: mannose-1-phosphate guanylyltransferase/mannose-6-phosphate isomerase [Fontimonas sp.]